jgi:hypothetical protein
LSSDFQQLIIFFLYSDVIYKFVAGLLSNRLESDYFMYDERNFGPRGDGQSDDFFEILLIEKA